MPSHTRSTTSPPRRTIIVGLALFVALCAFFVRAMHRPPPPPPVPTMERILKTGAIRVITRNNAHCYYRYRGQAMGFEYDLAHAFANRLGVRLEIRVADSWEGMIPSLQNGEADVIAASMTITPARRQEVAFSTGYLTIQQQIITHRQNLDISSQYDLNGKTVHVRRGTSYQERLERLKANGMDITLVLYDDVPTEELIRRVADREIDITVADSHIAMLNRRYYPDIVLAAAIGDKQQLGWAVRKEDDALRHRIDAFFQQAKQSGSFASIYNRYFSNLDRYNYLDLKAFHRRLKTRLPRYLEIIKAAAEKNGFDWRLITAQMYQESHFNPHAQSHASAYGLMQLTESTADSLGVKDIYSPRENIFAGVRLLKQLYDAFEKARDPDRLYIALAAYNIGYGHVTDARSLARSLNLDPNRWSSLTKTLPMLRFRKYYKNSKYGYCRGNQPINYIRQINIYYDILKRKDIEYARIPSNRNLSRPS